MFLCFLVFSICFKYILVFVFVLHVLFCSLYCVFLYFVLLVSVVLVVFLVCLFVICCDLVSIV